METLCETPQETDAIVVEMATFETALGWMAIAYDDALHALIFGHRSRQSADRALRRSLDKLTADGDAPKRSTARQPLDPGDLIDRLQRYAEGEAAEFDDVPVARDHLTEFGHRVHEACQEIPRGETRTYGQLAAQCGSPGAARAVGRVMAENRCPLVVPCHRVLAAGGGLGGFSAPGGLSTKRRLLELEA